MWDSIKEFIIPVIILIVWLVLIYFGVMGTFALIERLTPNVPITFQPSTEVKIAIEEACKQYGSRYQYRLWSDGKLEVNKGDGKWLNLKYKLEKKGKTNEKTTNQKSE